jgi:transmembrane sensor
LDAAEVERLLQWRRGQLVFSGQPLSQVVEEFNRYNRTQLVIADDAIAGVKIAGSFRTTDVQGLLKFLHERHGVVVGARKNEAGRPDTIQLARSGLKD